MGFRCPVLGCKSQINGMTGLMELDNLRKHYRRKHKMEVTMDQAMTSRSIAEVRQEREAINRKANPCKD